MVNVLGEYGIEATPLYEGVGMILNESLYPWGLSVGFSLANSGRRVAEQNLI